MSPRTSQHIRRAALILLAVLIVLAGWLGWQAYTVYRGVSTFTGRPVPRPVGEPTFVLPSFGGHHRVNFLLLGSDNDQKKEEAAPLTQTMIVVTIDPVHYRVGMLSIPRDFYVPVPGHGYNKIHLAFKYGYQKGGMQGGIALARETVERLFHIQIDYYGWVGLDGFSKVIDTFDGVTLDVQHPILDDSYPNDIHSPDPYGQRRLFIPAGWQHMDGPSALEYVRSRHGDIHGDFGRSERQQQVLLQLRQKVNATNIFFKLADLVGDLEHSVQTDLSLTQLYQLEQLSHHINHGNIHRVVLQAPTYCSYDFTRDGQSILRPHWNKIMPVVRAMFAPIAPARPVAHPSAVPTATPGHTATPGPSVTPLPSRTPAPTVTPTPAPAPLRTLPASLLYVQGGDIYRTGAGGTVQQLTYSHDAAMPALSPDGRTMAFVRFTLGLHKFDKYASDIWLMDLATRRQHVITSDESSVPANNLWAAWPSWSPDGRRIIFSSDRNKLREPLGDFRKIDPAVWSVPASGGTPVQLTTPAKGAGGDVEPAWRPHTAQFLYVSWAYPNDAANQPTSRLVLKDTRTGRATALTSPGGRVLQPAWAPGGTRLAYIRSAGGRDELVVAHVSGPAVAPRLTDQRVVAAGRLAQPAFTPDGRHLSYLVVDGDNFNLNVIPAAGGDARPVPGIPGSLDARWRPVWVR